MDKLSKEKQLYLSVSDKVKGVLNDNEDAKEIFDALLCGKNTYLRLNRIESSSFDNSWIENIEQCLPDLGSIVNNPRMVTKTTEDLTPVELAKKTNATSVMHLASHTQYIKDIDENGDVIPNKILSIGSDDDLKTYENRFIATLIRRLVLFVEKRYEFVKSFASLMDHEQLFLKNSSEVNGSQVSIETKIVVDSPKEEKIKIETNDYIKRIEQVREFVLYYYNSRFMKIFKTDKNVKNPILQTNIIRKNQKYHHCYELYRFIEAYDKLGVNYGVLEEYQDFSSDELISLNALTFINYLSLQGKDKNGKTVKKENEYQPTILTSSDDEEFVYGPLLKGPISFVRVDEDYQKYLDSQTNKDLKADPSTKEKAYYQDEYDKLSMSKEEYDEKIKLLERKQNDKLVFDEIVKKRIERKEQELEFLREKRLKKRHEEEEDYLKRFRLLMIDEARKFQVSDHDFGVYLSNEEYYDLKHGIGIITTIENVPTPVDSYVQPVSDFDEKIDSSLVCEENVSDLEDKIDSSLIDVVELKNEPIVVKEEVDDLSSLNEIKIVSSQVDDVELSNVEYAVLPVESEADKKLREAMEDETRRILEDASKVEPIKPVIVPQKEVQIINNFVPASLSNKDGRIFNSNSTNDDGYYFTEKENSSAISNNSLKVTNCQTTRPLHGAVLSEAIKHDKKYQTSRLVKNNSKSKGHGYLERMMKNTRNLKGIDETKYNSYYKNEIQSFDDDNLEEFGK